MESKIECDVDALKQRLPEYLAAIGHTPIIRANGASLEALCPLHDDHNPTFDASRKDDAWVWFCFFCGVGGTVIELHAARTDRSTKSDFKTICREVGELVGVEPVTITGATSYKRATPKPPPPKPSKAIGADELEEMTAPWRARLYGDEKLRNKFAAELKLSPDTLQRLTMPSLDALGIAPAGLKLRKTDGTFCTLRVPRLAYIGDGAYKIRDPFATGKPRFWRVGELRRPWRSHWLTRSAPIIADVHLVESESSAAALIEAGYESPFENGSCVCAASGADGFDAAWVPLFAGRTVHFWPDDNAAGERFYEETAAILHGTAKSIRRHNLKYQDA